MTLKNDAFEGMTVAITGGTSGIGCATALAFAQSGARVLALGLNAGGEDAPRHDNVTCKEMDVRDREALVASLEGLGQLDVLVNCAGVSRDRVEWTDAAFDEVIDINLAAAFRASQAARPMLARSGSGSIVNIASMYSTFGAADRPAYSASKGGMVQLTKSLAIEYASQGIRVNAVAPGWIETPLSRGLFSDIPVSAPIKARIPMGRWGQADEVADPILFLASPLARYITGVTLPIDGGYLTA
ncbi:SDR family NAD(P)-dependent oxidoreductase [Oricola sp.]|uniref:SDR family NAD(P)-dependent oxidoreductase n=1 Tax=Oricola sp. TaxID=1979950 RepID=UPI0025FC865C|nr:SDR family NAD(P)-dependent oxidoreductase [Oricola sp.]MCI5074156.1 SDR family oxidoreductase [Oricola sp.]